LNAHSMWFWPSGQSHETFFVTPTGCSVLASRSATFVMPLGNCRFGRIRSSLSIASVVPNQMRS
jgi:hypothetical protein